MRWSCSRWPNSPTRLDIISTPSLLPHALRVFLNFFPSVETSGYSRWQVVHCLRLPSSWLSGRSSRVYSLQIRRQVNPFPIPSFSDTRYPPSIPPPSRRPAGIVLKSIPASALVLSFFPNSRTLVLSCSRAIALRIVSFSARTAGRPPTRCFCRRMLSISLKRPHGLAHPSVSARKFLSFFSFPSGG